MLDMNLVNGALIALAVLVGTAIALSVAIVAVAAVTQRGQARRGGTGGAGGTEHDVPRHPAPDTEDARSLVLR